MNVEHPLEPEAEQMSRWGNVILKHIAEFIASLPARPASPSASDIAITEFMGAPPETARDIGTVLEVLDRASADAVETAGPGFMGAVPGGGLYASALGSFYTAALNRYSGLVMGAPSLAAIEEGVVGWIARDVVGLPATAGGLLTSGGSMANFSAVVAARHAQLGEDLSRAALYVSPSAHHSVAKAARMAGLGAASVRVVPAGPDLRMSVAAATALIASDRAAGLRPFLIVGTAGTTSTGTIDPLQDLAGLARREGLWFHVDAAYGGFFRLTERGRDRLAGMELADSVTLDPHKSLFLPFGTGALVVRDPGTLAAAHAGTGAYLQDVGADHRLADYSSLGPELTHEVRGIRVWLPLQLHGVAAFRAALDEKLDLTEHAYHRLRDLPHLEVPWTPDLTTVGFRVRPSGVGAGAVRAADDAGCRLLEQVNADGRVYLTSTLADNRYLARLTVLSHRTHIDRVDVALGLIAQAAVVLS